MANSMNDLMSDDESIEALSEKGVMDLYIRSKLMRAAMDKYRDHPEGWDAEGYQADEYALMNYSVDGLRMRALQDEGSANWLIIASSQHTEEAEWLEVVFDNITNSDWSDEKCLSVARDYLKDYLSGSVGMPDDKVIRENLKNYVEGED